MEILEILALPLVTWFGFSCLVCLFIRMHGWAKKKKGVAFALGVFVQMFLPDPKAQQTIEFVVEAKQKESKKSDIVQPQDKDKQ